jgi:hypothetical protein
MQFTRRSSGQDRKRRHCSTDVLLYACSNTTSEAHRADELFEGPGANGGDQRRGPLFQSSDCSYFIAACLPP